MAELGAAAREPMASAPMKYRADGTVDWGNMWESFCALAQEGGPPHRDTLLKAPEQADSTTDAYRFALAEVSRGIARVSGLQAKAASTGWLALECTSRAMATWLAGAIEAEHVQARADGSLLFVPVGEWTDVTKEIKNVITAVAKTTHYWSDHLSTPERQRSALTTTPRHVERVHSGDVVLDIGGDMGALVIYTSAQLRNKEIQLIRKDDAAIRTHVDVAERRTNGRTVFAAVYPPLAVGEYAIWLDYVTAAGDVTITSGNVTQLDWRR